jgi:hypothetical protein
MHYFNATACQQVRNYCISRMLTEIQQTIRNSDMAMNSPGTVRNAKKQPFCGLLHSNPAVVGRKSGSPENTNDDICTITANLRCPVQESGSAICRGKTVRKSGYIHSAESPDPVRIQFTSARKIKKRTITGALFLLRQMLSPSAYQTGNS